MHHAASREAAWFSISGLGFGKGVWVLEFGVEDQTSQLKGFRVGLW